MTDADPVTPGAENPVPVQDSASVDDQLSVEDWPAVIEAGLAASETVGAGGADTVTVVLVLALPPGPVQVIVYIVVCWGDTRADPEIPTGVKLVPEQEVILVELQVSVLLPPEAIEVGLALKVTVGAPGVFTVTVVVALALPPAPEQETE